MAECRVRPSKTSEEEGKCVARAIPRLCWTLHLTNKFGRYPATSLNRGSTVKLTTIRTPNNTSLPSCSCRCGQDCATCPYVTVLHNTRRGSRGGEMAEFSPPFFWTPFFLFFLIPQILIGSNTLLQKFTPHFKILDLRLNTLFFNRRNPPHHFAHKL